VCPTRLRPAQPPALAYADWSQVRAGQAVDLLDEDLWWRGVVAQVSLAGATVVFPGELVVFFC
jgi:hypothetical protein